MEELLYAEESYAIRGAVFEVYREMGSGFLEAWTAGQLRQLPQCEGRTKDSINLDCFRAFPSVPWLKNWFPMSSNHPGSTMLNGLVHEPVRVAGCRWIPKIVTTDLPTYTPHTEYSWACELIGDVPLLAAMVLEDRHGLYSVRGGRKSAATVLEVKLSFFPHNWKQSNDVTISLYLSALYESSGKQVTVHDAPLKQDPRGYVKLDLTDGMVVQTGTMISVGFVKWLNDVFAGIVVVAQTDTESCRCSRWRIKRRIAVDLPLALLFLKTGRRSVFSPREGKAGEQNPLWGPSVRSKGVAHVSGR